MNLKVEQGNTFIKIIVIIFLIFGLVILAIFKFAPTYGNSIIRNLPQFKGLGHNQPSDSTISANIKDEIKKVMAKPSPTPISLPGKINGPQDLNQMENSMNKVDIDNSDQEISSENFN